MAEMSPVELLRAGAALLRSAGAAASSGPWETGLDGLVWARRIGDPVSGSTEPEDAAWIALVNPLLTEPLAEMLENAADDLDVWMASTGRCGWVPAAVDVAWAVQGPALRVARVLLGVPDGR